MMTISKRISILAGLGDFLNNLDHPEIEQCIQNTYRHNPWFTPDNCRCALVAIRDEFLQAPLLEKWAKAYPVPDTPVPERIGLVMAGNIPLAGFHDLLSVFVAGHIAVFKLSDKDPFLLPFLIKKMAELDPTASAFFQQVDRLADFDRVIATGSNNSARYFESYFGKWPHIIRKNRNGIAVLSGQESEEQLINLCADIFTYFGLGCRNVAKLFVPPNYNFEPLLSISEQFDDVILHHKYKNNYDYNLALFLLNKTDCMVSSGLILKEDTDLMSRISVVHYEYYYDLNQLTKQLEMISDQWQCLVSDLMLGKLPVLRFGQAQSPGLFDYPDGVDVMAFLNNR